MSVRVDVEQKREKSSAPRSTAAVSLTYKGEMGSRADMMHR